MDITGDIIQGVLSCHILTRSSQARILTEILRYGATTTTTDTTTAAAATTTTTTNNNNNNNACSLD